MYTATCSAIVPKMFQNIQFNVLDNTVSDAVANFE